VPDADLLAALATHLNCSFEWLVVTYQHQLYAFALRLSGSPQDAEEIAQDAFVRAYRALASYPPERVCTLALPGWLYRIVLNVYRNRRRIRKLATVSLDAPEADALLAGADDGSKQPEAVLERGEGSHELAVQIAALPHHLRIAVVLRHVEGLSYAEIATILGQPIGTVKANVHRGVRLLRQALA